MSFGKSPEDESSKIVFGGYNSKYAQPDQEIVWNPLIDEFYWTVNMTGFSVNNKKLPLKSNQAVLDSGTSYILVPYDDFQTLKDLFSKRNDFFEESQKRACVRDKATGLLKCTCDYQTDLENEFPILEVQLNERIYKLHPEFYAVKRWDACYMKFASMPATDRSTHWILGDSFLLNFVTIFDLQNKQVALLEAKHIEVYSALGGWTFLAGGVLMIGLAYILGKDSIGDWIASKRSKKGGFQMMEMAFPVPEF